jgi:hypothetical protein
LGSNGSQYVPIVDFCEHCDEPKCSMQVTAEYMLVKRNRCHAVNCTDILRLFNDAFHLQLLHSIDMLKKVIVRGSWVNIWKEILCHLRGAQIFQKPLEISRPQGG